jgi:hypothetical protein
MSTTADAVLTTIRGLPALDFYVPSRHSRRTWTGDQHVALTLALGNNLGRVTAFTPAGDPTAYDLSQPPMASDRRAVLFMLHRAEPKARRVNPQPQRRGLVIQDADDGEASGVLEIHRAGAPVQRVEFADLAAGRGLPVMTTSCDPTVFYCDGEPGGGGLPPAPADTTFIRHLQTRNVCDNDDCNQGNEFEFKSRVYTTAGTQRLYYNAQHYGIGSVELHQNLVLFFDRLRPGDAYDEIEVLEMDDGWGNQDDHYELPNGGRPHLTSQQNTYYDSGIPPSKFFDLGDARCVVYNGSYRGWPNFMPPCDTTLAGNGYTSELQVAFKWRDF